MQLSRSHELVLYAISALLFLSGVGWLITHYLFAAADVSERVLNPFEPWFLRVHGAAMIFFLAAFGSLLPGHVFHGWRLRINHRSGIFLLAVIVILCITGYGLYYAVDDTVRSWISIVHWGVGLLSAAGLIVHVILGRQARGKTKAYFNSPRAHGYHSRNGP